MPRPRSNHDNLNIIDHINRLLPRHDYAVLMLERGVAAISPAALAALEKAGQIRLDYVAIASQLFVVDTPENEGRMAAAEKARVDRLIARAAKAPGWVVNRAASSARQAPVDCAARQLLVAAATPKSQSAARSSPP